jgi:hypothetical protein
VKPSPYVAPPELAATLVQITKWAQPNALGVIAVVVTPAGAEVLGGLPEKAPPALVHHVCHVLRQAADQLAAQSAERAGVIVKG